MLLLLACQAPAPGHASAVLAPAPDARVVDTGTVDTTPPDTGEPPVPDAEDPPVPEVRINEAMASNASAWDDGTGAWPDWVELYNPTDAAVPLARLTLRERSGQVWLGDEGEIAAGGFLMLLADGVELPFSLDADGDELSLSVSGTVTDRLSLGDLDADVAWARFPDGGEWHPTIQTTPGVTNGADPGPDLDPTRLVFHTDFIHDIRITLGASAVTSLRASRLSWVEGGVRFDEGSYDSVGVRLKAYVGSSRTIDQKCGFKIDLNRYEDRRWHGLKMVTLNNMVQDPTYVHEYMAYEVFRAAGVPAPRVAYAHVYVNDEYYGLYLMVESIDDSFLGQWYADTSGALYEGSYGVDLSSGSETSFDYDQGPDPVDYGPLTAVIDVLAGSADDDGIEDFEARVDLDEVLYNMAVEGLILHWDGYTTRNNYRLYHDPVSDRFQIIPWGTDQVFLTEYYGPWGGYGNLFTFCLENAACADRYDAILLEVADRMDALDLVARGAALEAWLRADIEADPRREFDVASHDYYLAATFSTIQTYPDAVRAQAYAR